MCVENLRILKNPTLDFSREERGDSIYFLELPESSKSATKKRILVAKALCINGLPKKGSI